MTNADVHVKVIIVLELQKGLSEGRRQLIQGSVKVKYSATVVKFQSRRDFFDALFFRLSEKNIS